MPDQQPEQKVDFSHYFEETKNNPSSKTVESASPVKGLQGLVLKMSFGLLRSKLQANIVLAVLSLLFLAAAAIVFYTPQIKQQSQVVKPSPLIHPTIK